MRYITIKIVFFSNLPFRPLSWGFPDHLSFLSYQPHVSPDLRPWQRACQCRLPCHSQSRHSNTQHLNLVFNPLESRGSATSNNIKLVHWPLMGGMLHLVQRGGDWAGPQPAQAPPHCNKCNTPPINGQCTNHRIAVWSAALRFLCAHKELTYSH